MDRDRKKNQMAQVFVDDVARAIARISDQVSFKEMLSYCYLLVHYLQEVVAAEGLRDDTCCIPLIIPPENQNVLLSNLKK
jgi:hypothetical protein